MQLARLVARCIGDGELQDRRRRAAKPFRRKYEREEVLLLAETDELHGRLSGPAPLMLLQRGWEVYGDTCCKRLAGLLEKLRVEQFTKPRARRSNDSGLAESKNGTVIRKQLDYGHIAGQHAERLDAFNREVLSPNLNYHRLCFFRARKPTPRARRASATGSGT